VSIARQPLRRLLVLVSAVVFVDTMFYAAVTPILPSLADEFDLSKTGAGVLVGSYAVGTLAGSLPGGWLAARLGARPTVALGLSLMSAAAVVFAFAGDVVVLTGARFVSGAAGAASWAGALAWLIEAAPRERRGELIGVALGAAVGGALFGPVLGGAAEALGRGLVFSAVAALGFAMAAAASRTPAVGSPSSPSLRLLAAVVVDRRVATALWLVVLPGIVLGTVEVLAPLRLDSLGVGAAAIAGVFLAGAGLEAFVNPIAGRFSDRRGRELPLLVGLAGAAVFAVALALTNSAWLLIALVIAAVPAIGVLWAPAIAMLTDAALDRGLAYGLSFALMNLAWAVGQSGGSLAGAGIGDALGDATAYLLLAAVSVLSTVLVRRARIAAPA
jgi:MFS family permease